MMEPLNRNQNYPSQDKNLYLGLAKPLIESVNRWITIKTPNLQATNNRHIIIIIIHSKETKPTTARKAPYIHYCGGQYLLKQQHQIIYYLNKNITDIFLSYC